MVAVVHQQSRIQRLPEHLANQIAAGEVVERPASVLKELLENSLDAHPTSIEVHLEQGGQALIRVRDNGHGIHKDDIALALDRHATSKISEFADMSSLQTLGFRGEALPSIAAVSRFSLFTRQLADECAWSVATEKGNEGLEIKPAAHPVGTTIEVRDLFFNTPARRAFLRKPKTEWLHCLQVFQRIAMSRPDVDMKLFHQHKLYNHYPVTDMDDPQVARIQHLCGARFLKQAFGVDKSITGLHISGWISQAEAARNQADMQYVYLNGRMIKDKLVLHAIRSAYQQHVYHDRHPAFVLFLDIDTQSVDVNVHPTKHEVRFQQATQVHDFIYSAINAVLQQVPPTNDTVDSTHVAETSSAYVASTAENKPVTPEARLVKTIDDRYVLYQQQGDYFVLDSVKAYVHVFEKRFSRYADVVSSQPLLLPVSAAFSESVCGEAMQQAAMIESFGVVLERQSPTRLMIRELPIALQAVDTDAFCQALLLLITQSAIKDLQQLITLASQHVRIITQSSQLQTCLNEYSQTIEPSDELATRELSKTTLQLLFKDPI